VLPGQSNDMDSQAEKVFFYVKKNGQTKKKQ
jgi:hypothetical protein